MQTSGFLRTKSVLGRTEHFIVYFNTHKVSQIITCQSDIRIQSLLAFSREVVLKSLFARTREYYPSRFYIIRREKNRSHPSSPIENHRHQACKGYKSFCTSILERLYDYFVQALWFNKRNED